MPRISLFGIRLSPFVEKVARALEYKAIEFELVASSGMEDAKKWNPQTGKMPVIEIDGERVHDSTIIMRRLDEIEPNPPLLSSDRSSPRSSGCSRTGLTRLSADA